MAGAGGRTDNQGWLTCECEAQKETRKNNSFKRAYTHLYITMNKHIEKAYSWGLCVCVSSHKRMLNVAVVVVRSFVLRAQPAVCSLHSSSLQAGKAGVGLRSSRVGWMAGWLVGRSAHRRAWM